MKPYDVKTADDVLAMESDNFPQNSDAWSILNSEDEISLHSPVIEGSRACWFTIPRDQFNAIVDWYMADQSEAHPHD